jgi:hypothetical protein
VKIQQTVAQANYARGELERRRRFIERMERKLLAKAARQRLLRRQLFRLRMDW